MAEFESEKLRRISRPLISLVVRATLVASFAAGAVSIPVILWSRESIKLDIVYNDGRSPERIELCRLENDSEELFISTHDLARIFKATKFWNPGNRKLVLKIGSHRYLFSVDTRVVVVDESPILLHVPARYADGTVMIPFEFVTDILRPRCTLELEYNERRSILSIGIPDYNVTGVEISDERSGTRAALILTEELHYYIDRDPSGVLRLKIYGGRLDPSRFYIDSGKGLVKRVRAEQAERDAFIFFELDKAMSRYKVEFETVAPVADTQAKRRLVLFFEKAARAQAVEERAALGKSPGKTAQEAVGSEPLRTVIIDPGHGGTDTGRVGRSGLQEKDLTLAIALSLRDRLLQQAGFYVVMTRTDDSDVSLSQRIETANTAKGQIFVSIHCNGWDAPAAQGFEVMFFSGAKAATKGYTSTGSTVSSSGAVESSQESGESDFVLWNMVQDRYVSRSSDLAEKIQREMVKALATRNRGVKQANLYMLRSLAMPAVQVEVGFITNPKEEKLLRTSDYRDRLADAIAEALLSLVSSGAGEL